MRELDGRKGELYRVELAFAGEDARAKLRRSDELSPEDLEAVARRLARMDTRSAGGAWTCKVLRRIAREPGRRAADLARSVGMERQRFKERVRKLKELGLTESLEVGYRLSPRGRVVLDELEREGGR